MTGFLARREHFARVGSTNDVVRGWLAGGTAEVCLASADEQVAGRGRAGRSWLAPPGVALLVSLGFRPSWLPPERAWQLAALASLAMAEAAEDAAGLAAGTIRLKWPNDLVVESDGGVRKLGGVLGETEGLGGPDPRVTVGLGVNVDWRAEAFPPDLAGSMTSLWVVAGDRAINRELVLDAFVTLLERGVSTLRAGRFDAGTWAVRQVTTGRQVRLEQGNGATVVDAVGVDPSSGALLVEDRSAPDGIRAVHVGEIEHVRLDVGQRVTAPDRILV